MKKNGQMEFNFQNPLKNPGDSEKISKIFQTIDLDRQSFILSKYLTNHNLNMACDQKSQAQFFDNRINKLLSTREASGFLGVSENALRILVCRKKIKAHKLGNRLKFKFSDLMNCLQQKEV